MSAVISATNIGKRYKIQHLAEARRYKTIRESLSNIFSKHQHRRAAQNEEFWALNGVDFQLSPGEVVGVIGRNGAGKSTLLKILSRITEPTTGVLRLRGTVASLLEVGTGFHPELTGRENIFLNGAILGMSRADIRRKFDEIVTFAGVEKFLDTPVKRYSSGMYVRLAFAVAAHIETEILVIDEVLAVGDAAFQKKCLGKIDTVAKSGKTILFVSHNMNAVEQLCNRVLMLEGGQLRSDSQDVRAVLKQYLVPDGSDNVATWKNTSTKRPPCFTLQGISITAGNHDLVAMPVRNDAETWIEIVGEITDPDLALTIGYAIYSEEGVLLYWTYHTDGEEHFWPKLQSGKIHLKSRIPSRFLNEGTYRIEAIASLHFRQWLYEPGVSAPHVTLNIAGGLSDSPYWLAPRPGVLAPWLHWQVAQKRDAEGLETTAGIPLTSIR